MRYSNFNHLSDIFKKIHELVNNEYYPNNKYDLTNTFGEKGGQIFFGLNYNDWGSDKAVKHIQMYEGDESNPDEIKEVLGNKKKSAYIYADDDKYHIVYKKEKEAIALYEFDKYINTSLHGFMNGTNSGKYMLTGEPLFFIDISQIDENFKKAIKWTEYINFFLAGRGNIVLYIAGNPERTPGTRPKNSYGNQKAVNHLLNYWISSGIDEEIGDISNNLSYNIRLSKSLFMGSSSTSNKDKLRDLYRIESERDNAKKNLLQKYITHPLINTEQNNLCLDGKPKEGITDEIKKCIERQYMFDIDDLCQKRLDTDNNPHYPDGTDYPKSQMSMYEQYSNTPYYYGYQIENENEYNIPCSGQEHL
jgi:hypothetical protein